MNAAHPPGDPSSPKEPFVADVSEGVEIGLYLALLELIDEGLIITSDETILEVNSAARRLLGREYRQLAGQPLACLFPNEAAFLRARGRLLIQGEMRGVIQMATASGVQTLRFIAAARIRPGIHALVIAPDHARADSAIADSMWPKLAAALDQPVLVIDERGRIRAVNRAAQLRLEQSRDALTGQPLEEVLDVHWPEPGAIPVAHLALRGAAGLRWPARILPGPRPGWQLLLMASDSATTDAARPVLATPSTPAPVHDLSRAFQLNQWRVHFQPLVDARGDRLHAGEALLRWQSPDGTLIPYESLAPSLSATHLMADAGNWILEAAIGQVGQWPNRALGLAVNVCTEQLADAEFASRVGDLLSRAGLSPARLELDLDETVLAVDDDALLHQLSELSTLGVRLAIDNFGQGAVAIAQLNRLPIRRLKLDPALVAQVGQCERAEAVVEAIITMASVLGLDVMARGVENAAQQAFLEALGCHLQQGPLFGEPMRGSAFRRYVADALREAPGGS